MDFNEYQSKASRTAVYPKERGLEYLTLGLVGESGELANKVKKILRGDLEGAVNWQILVDDLGSEIGDVLWYASELSRHLGLPFDAVAEYNLNKLVKRAEEGKIKGSGDNR